jgi:ribonuclease-3
MDCSDYTGLDFERLEFLGDRVLNLIISDYFYQNYPTLSEGEMTKRMVVASNAYLDMIVPDYRALIDICSPGFLLQRNGQVTGITSDNFEAWIGMLYLSEGFSRVKEVVLMLMSAEIDRFDPERNYIGILQEYFQKNGNAPPGYELIRSDGPPHKPKFTFQVTLSNGRCGVGSGGNKTDAKQEAARLALEHLTGKPE